ncbi:MAG: hypothetical protein WB777_23860 [Mycobacterium sp.]
MFAITLVAVGAAVATWLRPMPETKTASPSTPAFSDQQVADAKSKVCAAFEKVQKASSSNSGRNGGDDPNAQLLVAVNMRQVFMSSSVYLLRTLVEEPAAPAELASATKKLADMFQVITLDGLAGDRNDPGHDAANETGQTIENLCK